MGKSKWPERRPSEDFERILDPTGRVIDTLPDVSDAELLRWHETMLKTRMLEEMTVRLQRRGVFSVSGGGPGEEAAALGAAAALQPGDWIHPSYRQNSALLYWNAPLNRMLGAALGHAPEHVRAHLPLDPAEAPKIKTTPYAVFLGAHIPVAVGTALTDQLNKRGHVSLAFIGEGATSEGDFHDGLGLAGVLKVPLVVVIVNNGWSISIPASRQTAAETFAQKAVAHGIPHRRVDGNDVMAVYAAVKDAVDNARAGGGPFVIEAVTYRMTNHNTADEASLYREQEEYAFWQSRDPLARFEAFLAERGLLDADHQTAQRERIDAELRAAMDRALEIPPTPPETMFLSHLDGEAGWHFKHQQDELRIELAGGNPFLDFDGSGFAKDAGHE
jgi:pyruvate dehydrogenase E1 component alpha subunit